MIYAVNKRTKEHRIADIPQGMNGWVLDGCGDIWDVVQADADGWIEWDGGACPLPNNQDFEIRYKDGKEKKLSRPQVHNWQSKADRTGDRSWVAYRPILDTNPSEPEAPDWDGVGLPPTGAVIEAHDDYTQWQQCRVVAVEGAQLWLDYADDGYATRDARDVQMRPLRSAEDKAVEEMVEAIFSCYEDPKGAERYKGLARALYRAGYRKTATTDGEDV